MALSGIARIRSIHDQLSGSDAKIADYIINNPSEARSFTIQEFATATGLSTATISRFVKRIGYGSFRDFSLSLATVSANDATFFGEIDEDDDTKEIVAKVFNGAQNALTATAELLDITAFGTAVTWLMSANRVGLFGIGGSSIVAFNGYHKFLRTPLDVEQHPDYDVQLMQAVRMHDTDVAIVISHSGRNHDTLSITRALNKNHVKVIAITAHRSSELAKLSDLVLTSSAEEINIRSESMSSVIAQMTIIDALFTLVGVQYGDKTQSIVDKIRIAIDNTRE